jgi:hypothetical protein
MGLLKQLWTDYKKESLDLRMRSVGYKREDTVQQKGTGISEPTQPYPIPSTGKCK